ncbi:MAG: hypothetical protein JST06_07105 [Bacteroidetes bacterium]|nr:hypothetical protein [Bacteroidota bacterium]
MSKRKANSRHTTADGYAYLTKRIIVTKAKSAGRKAAKDAMATMGFVVTVQDGQLVRKHSDGHIEVLSQVPQVNISQNIQLG